MWLDFLGIRVGLPRPATTDPSADLRWGFEGPAQARGFDQVPFAGDEANVALYPLPDAVYRRFIRARATLDLGDGTLQTFGKAVRFIDPNAQVVDDRNMALTVTTALVGIMELADASGVIPRTAGVAVAFVEP